LLIIAVIVYSVREQRRGREQASRLISYEEEI
jgi:hypothetical protein